MTQRRIYQCAHPYFITFNVLNREWIFEDAKKAKMLHEIILNTANLKDHWVYQFCIMPDHAHLLCQTIPCHQIPKKEEVSAPPIFFDNGVKGGGNGAKGGGTETSFYVVGDSCLHDNLSAENGAEVSAIVGKNKKIHNISDFLYTFKSFFIYQTRKQFGVEYKFLQTSYYFSIVDSNQYLDNIMNYITNNPVKVKLPEKWHKHPYQYKDEKLISRLFI